MMLLSSLQTTLDRLISEFNLIPEERKARLRELSGFIRSRIMEGKNVYLNFICTHNSRRSHIAQIWAQAAAGYYSIPNVECYSGGTEATAFDPRAVKAMKKAGFEIVKGVGSNPVYDVYYASDTKPIVTFSKRYDDPFNRSQDFAAIMTCAHADENCPVVFGASKRITITYDDPKEFDGTPQEEVIYDERVGQIGREMLYAFATVKLSAAV